jgi:hypothetical protein
MAEDGNGNGSKKATVPDDAAPEPAPEETSGRTEDRNGISDFVRRAVSAGVGAARSSKDEVMRAAATEVRHWLEHMNLNEEFAKALAKMVIEVKTEIRFRPAEDGRVVPEATNEIKVKPPSR